MAPGPESLSEQLRRVRPFNRLGERDLRSALRLFEQTTVRKGKALYYQGDRSEGCWLLLDGRTRGMMYRTDESILSLGFSLPGDWLGIAEMLLSSTYLNDALTEESCSLAHIARTSFDRLLAIGTLREFFLREMARRYYVLHSRLELATPMDRLVGYLLERCTGDEPLSLSVTQEELAEAIGVSRETVNHHLALLGERGAVKSGRGLVEVPDPGALRRLQR